MNSVLFLGVALVTNMSITIRDQLLYLVLFTLAALFFLIRLHAAEERLSWVRRRIGDPRTISGLYLRGGAGFVTFAVIGSLFLTASASSAPLAGAWSGIDQSLIGIGQMLQRYFPAGGPGTRITGIAFGNSSAITGRWVTDSTPAISITLPADDKHVYYWRAIAYDSFDLNGWSASTTTAGERPGGTAILADTAEGTLATPVTREMTFSVTPLAYRGTTVFSPYAPATVSRNTRVSLLAGDFFNTLDVTAAGGYEVRASVPATALDSPEGITENKLRAAGQAYTDDIRRWYLEVPTGAAGPNMRALRDQIAALVPGDNPTPYDIARTTTAFLRSEHSRTAPTSRTSTAARRAWPSASRRTARATASTTSKAEVLSDRVHIVDAGQVIASGSPSELSESGAKNTVRFTARPWPRRRRVDARPPRRHQGR